MLKEEIIATINTKITEHTNEIRAAQQALDGIMSKTTLKPGSVSEAAKNSQQNIIQLGILKDKIIFHKACKLTLEDLLTEIN